MKCYLMTEMLEAMLHFLELFRDLLQEVRSMMKTISADRNLQKCSEACTGLQRPT